MRKENPEAWPAEEDGSRNLAIWLIVVILVIVVIIVATHYASLTKTVSSTPVALTTPITVGNHSYVKIGLQGSAREHVPEILQVLNNFEKQNSHFRVTTWQLDTVQRDEGTMSYVAGVWIDHVPKASQ